MNMLDNNSKLSLSDYHFKLTILLNCFLFLFYFLFRLYMALQLFLVEKQWLFREFHFDAGLQRYNLVRVFIPSFLLMGFVLFCFKLFKEESREKTVQFVREVIHFDLKGLRKYILFIFVAFVILSSIPGFLLLTNNLNTQYALVDIDSYVSMITLMWRGDYNTSIVPEGGFQFGKYYNLTMPTLILTWVLGIGNVVASYNIVVTLLIFFMMLNIVFTFRNFFYTEKDGILEEIIALLFIGALVLISLRFVVFRNYFNYDTILMSYFTGFYGIFGGMYLMSCILFIFSYVLREKILDFKQTVLFTLIAGLFSNMLVQSYFNLTLFLFPTSGIILAIILSRKTSWANTRKLAALFLTYLILNYASYLALDIFPRYSMAPIRKFNIMSLGLVLSFFVLLLLNRWLNNMPLKVFLKYRSLSVLTLFFLPFLWYCNISGDPGRIELLSYSIKLGATRIYLLVLLLYALVFGYLLFGILKLTVLRKRNYLLYGLIGIIFLISLFKSRAYDAKRFLPFEYPAFYPEDRKIMDRTNLYAFDENGIKVTYNKYLVDVIKYFVRNRITDTYYWLVSKTPSNGVYENGLLQRILCSRGHALEGITVKHFDSNEEDIIPEWAKIRLDKVTVKDYDDFAKHIFDIEKETRYKIKRFKNRYLILDNNFPEDILKQLNTSPLFRKMYENKLYKVYRMESL